LTYAAIVPLPAGPFLGGSLGEVPLGPVDESGFYDTSGLLNGLLEANKQRPPIDPVRRQEFWRQVAQGARNTNKYLGQMAAGRGFLLWLEWPSWAPERE
jgi:hypothetical protein